jgi:uncharacterized membrane protein
MAQQRPTTDRLATFSDGVFAVIITIMVLDLKPPEHPTFAALRPLWPTALSYLVSYYFIAIVWLNHHHLLRFFPHSTASLIWINFVHLFMVSLVPFSTAWVAETRFAKAPAFVYAAVFVLVNVAYIPFEWHALSAAPIEEISLRTRGFAKVRSAATLGTFILAMLVSLLSSSWGFGLVCSALLFYLRPEPPWTGPEGVNNLASSNHVPLRHKPVDNAAYRSEI